MFDKNSVDEIRKFLIKSLTTDQFMYILREVEKDFEIDKIKPERSKFTLNHSQVVELAVEYFLDKNKLDEVLTSVLSKEKIHGKDINFKGTDRLIKSLSEIDITYNPETKNLEKVKSSGNDFGKLFEGKAYSITIINVDIVNSTKYIKDNDEQISLQFVNSFKNYINSKVNKYNGRIWKWEGDGGIIAFHEANDDAIVCAIEILIHLCLYNSILNPLDENVKIRIAADYGKLVFRENFEDINSDLIYLVEKLQANYVTPDNILITDDVFMYLNGHLRSYFEGLRVKSQHLHQFNKEKVIKLDS